MSERFLDFEGLLERALHDPDAEAELHRRHGTRAAVLVADFTGMGRRTGERGIVHALALARAAERAMALPGTRVKRVADTVFHVYDTPAEALLAALDAGRRLAAFNRARADHIHACVGLGWGDVLLLPGEDVYGDEVTRAFVLGEDVARGGEVLATDAFLGAIGALPAGVGAFRAPEDRESHAGFGFHVLADHRD